VVFVDNNSIGTDVWFDNVQVSHYNGEVLEENHYYPFGLTISESGIGVDQPYKLTTKELEKAFDLNMYDFGARQFDMQLGRWTSIDPLAELMRRHSPYNYAFNNPIRFIDPDGMTPKEYFNESGKRIGQDEKGNDGNIQVVTDKEEKKLIEENTKKKSNTSADLVNSGLNTTKGVLQESLNVLDRDNQNGGTKEEISVVKGDGTVIKGEPGSDKSMVLENGDNVATAKIETPEGSDNTLIHSHKTSVVKREDGAYILYDARQPGPEDPSTFKSYKLNVIVGPLGEAEIRTNAGNDVILKPNTGAVFYNSDTKVILELSKKAMQKIVNTK